MLFYFTVQAGKQGIWHLVFEQRGLQPFYCISLYFIHNTVHFQFFLQMVQTNLELVLAVLMNYYVEHLLLKLFLEHELVFRFILNGGPPQKVVVRSQRPLSGGDWQQVLI